MIVLVADFPHSSMKCITSPSLREGWPVNTMHGHLKSFCISKIKAEPIFKVQSQTNKGDNCSITKWYKVGWCVAHFVKWLLIGQEQVL